MLEYYFIHTSGDKQQAAKMKKNTIKSNKSNKICDAPGCTECGEYRAPKDRRLTDYYWFCLKHVTEYNKNWDFYLGLSSEEIESHIQNDTTWQRPTWKLGQFKSSTFSPDRTKDTFNIFNDLGLGMDGKHNPPPKPEEKIHGKLLEAVRFMELDFPLKLSEVKKQYKRLAKKYHPDINNGDKEAEKLFKKLNESYRYILKQLGETK